MAMGPGAGTRKLLLVALAALLGAALVVLPALALSEAATIEAVSGEGPYKEQVRSWRPASAEVAPGTSVAFQNASTVVSHGVVWSGGPEVPSCTGVPVNQGATSWKGTCTFNQPGTYTFYCYVHPTEMRGTITVVAPPATTTQSTGQSPPPGTSTSSPPTQPVAPGSSGAGSSALLAGPAARALKLAASQRGQVVRGSVAIAAAGAGGSLQVDALARPAALAAGARGPLVRVGRFARAKLAAGTISFAVSLNRHARSALRHRGRLALVIKVQLSAPGAGAFTSTHSIVLRAPSAPNGS